MFGNRSRRRGFIRMIILIVVALVLLKYFFNLTFYDIVNNAIVQELWSLIKQTFAIAWDLLLVLLDFLKQLVGVAQSSVDSMKK